MIKLSELKHKVEFYEPVKSKDASGEITETYNLFATRFAGIRPATVEATTENGVEFQVSKLELTVRYSLLLEQNVKPDFKVVVKGKDYIIDEVGDVFSKEKLTYLMTAYE